MRRQDRSKRRHVTCIGETHFSTERVNPARLVQFHNGHHGIVEFNVSFDTV